MVTKPKFNKATAFDELTRLVQLPTDAAVSDTIKSILNAQNYLQEIYDSAFKEGFEKGCEATKKIDEID